MTSASSALASTSTSVSSSSNSPSVRSSKTDAGTIAGGAIGCAFGGALLLALLFWLYAAKRRVSQPDPGTSPQTSEYKITDPPSSTGLPVVPSSAPSTTTIPSPPPLTDSLTPAQQVYQDALQKTYVSIRYRHLTWDADISTVGSRRYPYILYNPTFQKRARTDCSPTQNIIGVKLDNTMLISLNSEYHL